MPMELALHHTEPHDAVVHSAERLVIPSVLAGIDEFLNVDELQGSVPRVQVDRVWRLTTHMAPLSGREVDDAARAQPLPGLPPAPVRFHARPLYDPAGLIRR